MSDLTGSQNKTAKNDKYIRYFWEVSNKKIGISKKWVFYAKRGKYRKYYGNLNLIVNWSRDARNFYKNNKTSNLLNEKYWFKEGITYTKVSSIRPTFRYLPPYCVFDMGGPSICYLHNNLNYILGFLNSKISNLYLNILNPTINIQTRDIKLLPIIIDDKYKRKIEILVRENIQICKNDWDDYETSWNFKTHPLIKFKESTLQKSFDKWKEHKNNYFHTIYEISYLYHKQPI
ncbi:hypothetical protein BGI41_00845 [Methanobrevibacter sp. 87.7]|uniref:hypothetical protein n=1 Tax=Methanobrevibacter sp. 87.7 TaxID=387957 RepID=UPI000B50211A|nr:hypothetical protein [Methanobrevibacter sp. 87.7]OWT33741.1 hypothetical protein BGI41_00845 [Methanobrevibacter sp. 87.7]